MEGLYNWNVCQWREPSIHMWCIQNYFLWPAILIVLLMIWLMINYMDNKRIKSLWALHHQSVANIVEIKAGFFCLSAFATPPKALLNTVLTHLRVLLRIYNFCILLPFLGLRIPCILVSLNCHMYFPACYKIMTSPEEIAKLYREQSRFPSLSRADVGPVITSQYGGKYNNISTGGLPTMLCCNLTHSVYRGL